MNFKYIHTYTHLPTHTYIWMKIYEIHIDMMFLCSNEALKINLWIQTVTRQILIAFIRKCDTRFYRLLLSKLLSCFFNFFLFIFFQEKSTDKFNYKHSLYWREKNKQKKKKNKKKTKIVKCLMNCRLWGRLNLKTLLHTKF